jgi:hypothetical protein
MGMTDSPAGVLTPRGSVIQSTEGTDVTPASLKGNRISDTSSVKDPYAVSVDVLASRTYPAFRQSTVIAQILPPNLMGDWHLTGAGSPAFNAGIAFLDVVWGTSPNTANRLQYRVSAPGDDLEATLRPTGTRFDAGAHQLP